MITLVNDNHVNISLKENFAFVYYGSIVDNLPKNVILAELYFSGFLPRPPITPKYTYSLKKSVLQYFNEMLYCGLLATISSDCF